MKFAQKGVLILETLDIITNLLKQQHKKQKDLTDFLGLGKNAFTTWKSGHTKSYKKYLPEIAEFFGVSTDYLLGRTEEPKPEKSFIPTQETANSDNGVLFLSTEIVPPIPPESKTEKSHAISNDDFLKFALYGNDDADITPEMLEDVRNFAKFIREKKKGDNK